MTAIENAEFTSLKAAGLTYGDTFTAHGVSRQDFRMIGVDVTIKRHPNGGNGFLLVDTKGERYEQGTALGRGKFWISR